MKRESIEIIRQVQRIDDVNTALSKLEVLGYEDDSVLSMSIDCDKQVCECINALNEYKGQLLTILKEKEGGITNE